MYIKYLIHNLDFEKNKTTNDNATPLQIARQDNHTEIIRFLEEIL